MILPLRPKLFALLRYLVDNPGRLVTREEILTKVWPRTTISEGVLRGCVRALREVLQDDAAEPRRTPSLMVVRGHTLVRISSRVTSRPGLSTR